MAEVGRPAWVPTEEILQEIESLAGCRLKKYEIARCIGLHPSTFFEKLAEYPQINESIKKGKAKALAQVADALIKKGMSGNVTALIFYLKNHGWTDESSNNKKQTTVMENYWQEVSQNP